MKELMDSELVDISLLNASKNEEANKRNQKKAEEEKNKKTEVLKMTNNYIS
jgi:hypothetical protein